DDYTLGEEEDDGGSDSESLMQGISDKPHIEERGNGEDDAAAYLLKSLAGEVEKFCNAKGFNRATYALTDTYINAFHSMVKEVNGSLVLLKANPNDTNA
ncbi:hypothetical protein V498_08565, partial [Pseudogymnoascus sp. VKM F-4517 (FW-2822)]